MKFRQARFEDLAGNHKTAELLRNEAEAIYDELARGKLGGLAAHPGGAI